MKSTFVLPLLFWGLAGHTSIVLAQSPGTFTATGNLTTERMFHSATLLTNGRVLITGGFSYPGLDVWASADLYDPSTGTFTATGNMTTPRDGHTATLLPGGKVLIAGGRRVNDSKFSIAQAELYDPATGTFTATGDMTTARSRHTATLLNNGKVLIAGGHLTQDAASAELYDPATGTFTATGSMQITDHTLSRTAALLSNGKVLILHGNPCLEERAGSEHYDPETGTFSLTSETGHTYGTSPETASLLPNGRVLVTLGYGGCDYSKFAEAYDPANGTFISTGTMTGWRLYHTATLLPDGKVLIAGRDAYNTIRGSADLYDPVTGAFSATAEMALQRGDGHTATLLPDGTVLMAGGFVCCGRSVATAEIYRPAVLVRSPVLSSVAGGAQGAILHSGSGLLVSAGNPAVAGNILEIYLTGLTDGSLIPPQVDIGGRMAEVLFFGKAPGIENLNQVNVRVPGGVTPGSAVGVRLTYLARPSNEVTIAVQ